MARFIRKAFLPYFDDLMSILETNKEMRKTAQGIFKQVAWTAGGTAVGGICGGPLGAMVGGVAGSVIGYCVSSDYDNMISVLRNLTDEDKQNIMNRVHELVGSTSIEALTNFIATQVHREALLQLLRSAASELKRG